MASSLGPSDWARLTDDAFKGDLAELGWRGKYRYDDEEVVELRAQLDRHAGIPGMELIDPAMLRPGRLEVHVYVGQPNEEGRIQILNIHTRQMREQVMYRSVYVQSFKSRSCVSQSQGGRNLIVISAKSNT